MELLPKEAIAGMFIKDIEGYTKFAEGDFYPRPPVYLAPSRDLAWVDAYARRESSPFNHHLFRRFNAIARAAYDAHGLPVMDVERPMLHRVDGHMDPLHYCLPGPPDFYSYVLWNFALGQ